MIIYCTTNLINGRKYIGKDSNNNPNYLGSGTYILKAIKKYGKKNFTKEILSTAENKKQLIELEEYWINKLDAFNNPLYYNATKYSSGITIFPEDKKINISNKNKNNKYHSGHKQTDFQKSQTSKANTGKPKTQHFIDVIRNKNKNNQYTLGYKFTEEQKLKIILGKSKPILQYDLNNILIKEWIGRNDIFKILNISKSGMTRICNKGGGIYKNYYWKYK